MGLLYIAVYLYRINITNRPKFNPFRPCAIPSIELLHCQSHGENAVEGSFYDY
jgi:hypothetical protein